MSQKGEEFVVDKLYYTIGEVSKMLDVKPSLIRYWESEFTLLNPKKRSNGNRSFTVKDIETLKLIYHLVKEKGYTLDGAKKRLRENRELTEQRFKIVKKLLEIRGFLSDLKV